LASDVETFIKYRKVLLKISKNLVRYKSKNNVGLLNKVERLNADDNKF